MKKNHTRIEPMAIPLDILAGLTRLLHSKEKCAIILDRQDEIPMGSQPKNTNAIYATCGDSCDLCWLECDHRVVTVETIEAPARVTARPPARASRARELARLQEQRFSE